MITMERAIAVIAFFFAPGFLSPPNRWTSRLYLACSRARTSDRGPGRLDQHRLDVSPGVPGPPVLAFACADVIPRAQRDPGG